MMGQAKKWFVEYSIGYKMDSLEMWLKPRNVR